MKNPRFWETMVRIIECDTRPACATCITVDTCSEILYNYHVNKIKEYKKFLKENIDKPR